MTAKPKKIPGMLQDPWRSGPTATPATPTSAPKTAPKTAQPTPTNLDEDGEEKSHIELSTIELKGYGAITIGHATTAQGAAGRLLEFAVINRKDLEKTFTEFGIVIAQMPLQGSANLKFYIQRTDGWILAIPGAVTRDAGCLQLIQALLQLNTIPILKKKLEDARISVYKF